MSFSETISPLIGRWMMSWFYLMAALHAGRDWHEITQQMSARHVPLAPLILMIALVLVFLGVVSLAFGYQARHGAILLFGITLVAAFILHDYWHIDDPAQRVSEFGIFTRDVAISGGLLLIVGMGPGRFAIDGKPAGGEKKKE